MRDHKFSYEDPVLVLDFLTIVVEKEEMLGMNEVQIIGFLTYLLSKNATQQFRSNPIHSRSGGLVSCPNAVQYLFRTHATKQTIAESVQQLENIIKDSNEEGNTFASWVLVSTYVYGKVYSEVNKSQFSLTALWI